MPDRLLRTRALTSRKLGAVTGEAEALYYRLMLVADDYGRFHADADLVRSACYPRGERDVARSLAELIEAQAIFTYEHDGETYLVFSLWDQKVRAKSSKFPPPPTDVDICLQMSADAPVFGDVYEDDDEVPPAFADFWQQYPNKIGKRAARAAFEKALKRAPAESIIAGAKRYREAPKPFADYHYAHPTTWLNQDRWEDEPSAPPSSGAAGRDL